jgi:hypothetical protein
MRMTRASAVVTMASFALAAVQSVEASNPLGPESVVRGLVKAVNENDLRRVVELADLPRIATRPRHAQLPEDLVETLGAIDPDAIRFQEMSRTGRPRSAVVRMTAPLSLDFDLELRPSAGQSPEAHYRVVGIHP